MSIKKQRFLFIWVYVEKEHKLAIIDASFGGKQGEKEVVLNTVICCENTFLLSFIFFQKINFL